MNTSAARIKTNAMKVYTSVGDKWRCKNWLDCGNLTNNRTGKCRPCRKTNCSTCGKEFFPDFERERCGPCSVKRQIIARNDAGAFL